jgi:site-specific recombinase XerD
VSVDEAAVMVRVHELLGSAPELPEAVTLAKLVFAYGIAADAQGVPAEEIVRHAALIRWAWEVVEDAATLPRPPGPRFRLLLDDEPKSETVVSLPTARLSDLELIDRYVVALQRRNLAPRSIVAVSGSLRTFATANRGSFATATRASLEEFLDGRGLGPRRRYWWLSALHGFYAWAIDEGLLEEDPTVKIRRPKLTRTLPRPMPDADLRRAVDGAEPMVRCWLLLGAFAGLRCQEIAGLAVDDVLEYEGLLRVVYGKGRKERMLPLHPDVLAALLALPMPASGFVFRRKRMLNRYPPAQLVQELNAYLCGLGIESTAHSLRHYFASAIYEETHDLRLVQELLGHSDPATTAIYTKSDTSKSGPAVRALRIAGR